MASISRMFANEITRLPKWEIYAPAERVVIQLGKQARTARWRWLLCTNTVNGLREMGSFYICYKVWQVSSEEF